MDTWQQRIAWTVATVVAIILAYAALYQWGMNVYEDLSIPYVQAVQVVIESITTAGFGGHAPWSSTLMNGLVLAMNLTGVLFVFLAIPLFVVPMLRDAFERRPPDFVEQTDHIVLTPHTPRVEAVIEELEARSRDYVILEPDAETARELHRDGCPVIHGDPSEIEVLERAYLPDAEGFVVDTADDTSVSVILSAREMESSTRVVSVIDDQTLESYHRMAGADRVLSPRQLLGESLAHEVPFLLPVAGDQAIEIGEDLEIAELDVNAESRFRGQTIEELQLRERYGVEVVGAWFNGVFESPVSPHVPIDANTRLLVSGEPQNVRAFQEEISSTLQPLVDQRIIIAGYGQSGRAAADVLSDTSVQPVIIDESDHPNVDIVGDVRNPEVLEGAGVAEAAALIIDVDDDTTAMFATLIAREANPDLFIIARANRESNVRKIHRAGADYVQSLATVSGRMVVSTVLEEEKVLALEERIDVVRLEAGRLAEQTLAQADVRAITGCTVLAALRDGEMITSLDPQGFVFQEDDQVIIVGTDGDVHQFEEQFLAD